jgi:hypothetical protein
MGDKPLRKLFSKEQRAFYAEHAPDGLALDDLVALGPIFVLKLKGTPSPTGARWSWSCGCTPTGLASSSCRRRRAVAGLPGRRRDPRLPLGAGIEQATGQQTKTRKALAYFSKHLD